MELMEKVAECPVCLERLTPPVKLCKNEDVAVCAKCAPSFEKCPGCGEEFNPRKSVFVNNLIEAMPVACKNTDKGCYYVMIKENIIEHEKICNYNNTRCCVAGCKIDIVYHTIGQHLKSAHNGNFCEFNFGTFREITLKKFAQSSLSYYWIFTESNCGKKFLVKYVVDKKILYICAQYLGMRERASKYLYEVSFDQGQSITYSAGTYCTPYIFYNAEMKKDPNVLSFNIGKNMFHENLPTNLKVKCKIVKYPFVGRDEQSKPNVSSS